MRKFICGEILRVLIRIITLSILLTLGSLCWGLDIHSVSSNEDLGRWVSYIEFSENDDESESYDLEFVSKLGRDQWYKQEGRRVNFGYSNDTFWFKQTLVNNRGYPSRKLLKIGYSVLDYIDVYIVRNTAGSEHYSLGDKLNFNNRVIQNRHFLIPLSFEENESLVLYLRIKTNSSVQLPLSLWEPEEFYQVDQVRMLFHGVYFGIALIMIIYNLFVYRAVAEKSYLYYVACITCMSLFLASLNSLTFQYIWPTSTWWNDQSIVFFLNGVVLFGGLFTIEFLSINRVTERALNRFILLLSGGGGILMLLSLGLPYQLVIRPTIYVATTACILLILVGSYRWLKGDISARYFTVAWFSLLVGGIVLAFNKFTLLPQNVFTENATQIGSGIEIILLSLALADRLYQEKLKTFIAQKEANVMLEQRVQERTIELEELNDRLMELSSIDALTKLKNRGFFEETFQKVFESAFRYQRPLSLLVIDIDYFKNINDKHGHQSGDYCLKMVSETLRELISRPQDLVARYGGEEFVVLLPETPSDGALQVAEKLRKKIEDTPYLISEIELNLTVSIGAISLIPDADGKRKDMFDRADVALYKAKKEGRNRVEIAL